MGLENILSQFSSGTKKTVYMSITPGVGLELIELDLSAKTVKNYAYRPLEYNEALREIPNIEEFKNAVTELFTELKLNIRSNVVLNVPMVLLGSKELPLIISDDQITEALISEVEQSYIFRRYEPVVCWQDDSSNKSNDMRRLFYTAIQNNTIEDLKNALSELGANLVSVEISLMSVLKALSFSGLTEDIKEGVSWNLMIVNQNGYSICSMVGNNIIDFYEEPLAIKSFEGDEIYNAINASVQIALMSYPANFLYIVSETDMVSAEFLSSKLQNVGVVKFFENNDYKKQDVIPVSLEVIESSAHKISLEAIGIATGSYVSLPFKFDFLEKQVGAESINEDPNEPIPVFIGSREFSISPNMARNFALIICVILLIPVLALFIAVPAVVNKKQSQLDDVTSRVSQVQSEITRLEQEQNKSEDFDVNIEIKKVLSNNRAKLMGYIALGESVPKKLWITYFSAKDEGKFDIKGGSSNVEDIYAFFRNMKDSLINTQLRLHKLELQSDSVDDVISIDSNKSDNYEFEITNMTASELNGGETNTEEKKAEPENIEPNKEQTDNKDNKQMLNKPLLNFGKKD